MLVTQAPQLKARSVGDPVALCPPLHRCWEHAGGDPGSPAQQTIQMSTVCSVAEPAAWLGQQRGAFAQHPWVGVLEKKPKAACSLWGWRDREGQSLWLLPEI